MDWLSGRILTADGTVMEGRLGLEGDRIAIVEADRAAEPSGRILVPGAVDLHGDAFESWIMPRPGTFLPLLPALLAADRALAASGITTAFLSPTLSWEPGLRGAPRCGEILRAGDVLAARRTVDTRIHLRFETGAVDHAPLVDEWLAEGRIGLLSINDHIGSYLGRLDRGAAQFEKDSKRARQSPEEYLADIIRLSGRREEMLEGAERLVRSAVSAGVPAASHDDTCAGMRRRYRALGARVADFPTTEDAMAEATRAGEPVIVGAPNVVRGGSHMVGKGVSAAAMITRGLAGVVASDYAYSAVPQAAVALWRDHGLSFGAAWHTVSRAPALAMGLDDRGALAPGMRADVVELDVTDPAIPQVLGVWCAGALVLSAGRG